ncbi:MAG: glycosyltransferase family 4 protein [Acidimicrobiales bacterium]
MTRIALIPSSYPPSLGGVEELTRHLALSLCAAGDQVEVWTGQPDDATPETVEFRDGLVVRRLPMPLPATNWSAIRRTATTGVRSLFSLRSAVSAFRPDVLHVQCFGPNGAYAEPLSRMTGLPLVISLQGETLMDDADIFDTSRVLRRSLRTALRRAAAVTACSAFTLADAESRFGLEPGLGTVIPNGVELADVPGTTGPAGEPRWSGAPDRPYVFAVGRVVEKKGFDLLLAAFAAMAPGERAVDLVIAGTGTALDSLRRDAEALGLGDRVHFVGKLTRQDVSVAMAGADLFVMPSRLEPFGIVVLEAWRAGVAVVATDRGGPPEFVRDGIDGVLVDPSDTTSFSTVLADLLADHDRRGSIARAGRSRVGAFAWPVIAGRYQDVYRSLAHGRQDARERGGARGDRDAPAEPTRAHQGESVG